MTETIIHNARVVLDDEVISGHVCVSAGRITAVGQCFQFSDVGLRWFRFGLGAAGLCRFQRQARVIRLA